MKFVVDLDDTLVSSTKLNNDAYNFALEEFGYKRIFYNKRITRELLTKHNNVEKIIERKQQYLTLNWLPYRVVLNNVLLKKLKIFGRENCFIWTKADKVRTNKILDLCNLRQFFCDVIFDKKESFVKSKEIIKKYIPNNKFIIYENNFIYFANENIKIVDKIKNKNFNVQGYLVL